VMLELMAMAGTALSAIRPRQPATVPDVSPSAPTGRLVGGQQ
jgi:hypothetical protein